MRWELWFHDKGYWRGYRDGVLIALAIYIAVMTFGIVSGYVTIVRH